MLNYNNVHKNFSYLGYIFAKKNKDICPPSSELDNQEFLSIS